MTATSLTDVELMAMWGGDPHYRVQPVFAEGSDDIENAKEVLRQILGPENLHFTIDPRDAGIDRMRHMASVDSRCYAMGWAAELLAAGPADWFLVMGWSLR